MYNINSIASKLSQDEKTNKMKWKLSKATGLFHYPNNNNTTISCLPVLVNFHYLNTLFLVNPVQYLPLPPTCHQRGVVQRAQSRVCTAARRRRWRHSRCTCRSGSAAGPRQGTGDPAPQRWSDACPVESTSCQELVLWDWDLLLLIWNNTVLYSDSGHNIHYF